MKILLTGCNGQLGHQLNIALKTKWDVIPLDIDEMDLTNKNAIQTVINNHKPDLIIHPAAYTQVDLAETEKDIAFKVNADAPFFIADEAKKLNIPLIHISTDFIFDGFKKEPYLEDDPAKPLGVYGQSKMEGEDNVINSGVDYIIFRTSWVYGSYGKNFYNTIKRLAIDKDELKVVNDQIGAPTSTLYLSSVISEIIDQIFEHKKLTIKEIKGVYHLTCGGSASWFDFAFEIAKDLKEKELSKCMVLPIPTTQYPTPAKRPKYSVLDNHKINQVFGVIQTPWIEALKDVIKKDQNN